MFRCWAFGCFTASLWALISFQTAGVLTNQAFHVSLSFTLFCFSIHTRTPKRMDKILSFSEAVNGQQLTWLKWVLCLTSSILRLTGEDAGERNEFFNFFVVYFAVDDLTNCLGRRLNLYVHFWKSADMFTQGWRWTSWIILWNCWLSRARKLKIPSMAESLISPPFCHVACGLVCCRVVCPIDARKVRLFLHSHYCR